MAIRWRNAIEYFNEAHWPRDWSVDLVAFLFMGSTRRLEMWAKFGEIWAWLAEEHCCYWWRGRSQYARLESGLVSVLFELFKE